MHPGFCAADLIRLKCPFGKYPPDPLLCCRLRGSLCNYALNSDVVGGQNALRELPHDHSKS